MIKKLRTRREVIDFMHTLSPDEARAILQVLNGSPEIMKVLRTKGLFVKKRRLETMADVLEVAKHWNV